MRTVAVCGMGSAGAFAICSSHIRQGGHQNASPLVARLLVWNCYRASWVTSFSIPDLGNSIYSVSNNNFDAVMKFMMVIVTLQRRIINVLGDEDFHPGQVICASERSFPVFSSTSYCVSTQNKFLVPLWKSCWYWKHWNEELFMLSATKCLLQDLRDIGTGDMDFCVFCWLHQLPLRFAFCRLPSLPARFVEVRVWAVTEHSAQERRLNCTLDPSQYTFDLISWVVGTKTQRCALWLSVCTRVHMNQCGLYSTRKSNNQGVL